MLVKIERLYAGTIPRQHKLFTIRVPDRNREIAFYKASAIAQGCNLVRMELGLPTSYIPAADPTLQIDIVPKTATR